MGTKGNEYEVNFEIGFTYPEARFDATGKKMKHIEEFSTRSAASRSTFC